MAVPTLYTSNIGVTFYVDAVNGNDANTAAQAQVISTPWLTLNKAYTYLRDTHVWTAAQDIRIYIRAGTYQAPTNNDSTLKIEFSTGAARFPSTNQRVIWEAYPGDARPVVKLPAGTSPITSKYGIRLTTTTGFSADYQIFKGFNINGEQTRSNVTVDTIGFYVDRADNCEFIDLRIHGIYAMDTTGTLTSKAQGVYLAANSIGHKFTRCRIYDIGTTTGTIDIQEHCIYDAAGSNFWWNNLFYDAVNGFGCQFYNGGAVISSIYFVHNTVAATVEKSCIVAPGHGSSNIFKNNILYGATQFAFDMIPATFTGASNVYANNVDFNNTSGRIARNGVANNAAPAGWTFASELTSNPLFTNVGTDDYSLTSTSPAINYADATDSPTTDILGALRSTPDAGAFELISSRSPGTMRTRDRFLRARIKARKS